MSAGHWLVCLIGSGLISGSGWLIASDQARAEVQLPPADDLPEEVLRTEIIFEARSPLDGSPMSPADYVVLQTELQAPPETISINSELRQLIFLLQLRGAIRPIVPLLP
jgi:hypothetical protein